MNNNTLTSTIGVRYADILLVIGATAIIAVAAQIAVPVPFTPVPLTLQPLAVLLVGAVLGSARGAAAAALYLVEGMSGLPVFSQGHGGAIWLVGPTAGYLWSYPVAAFLAGWLGEHRGTSTILRSMGSMLLGL
ncbi:MAG: biotin transporter BioY, partial [Thermoanaerobaculia bacterium]